MRAGENNKLQKGPGMSDGPPEFWLSVYESAPALIKWALWVLSLGLITLLGTLWRWHRREIERLERSVESAHQRVDENISTLQKRVDDVYRLVSQMSGAYETGGGGTGQRDDYN